MQRSIACLDSEADIGMLEMLIFLCEIILCFNYMKTKQNWF